MKQTSAHHRGSEWQSGSARRPAAETTEIAPTLAWAASPGRGGGEFFDHHFVPLGESKRRTPTPRRAPPHSKRAMRAARLVQIHQGLLQTMRGCLGQPWMLGLGVDQLVRLLGISNPCPAPAVLTTLF